MVQAHSHLHKQAQGWSIEQTTAKRGLLWRVATALFMEQVAFFTLSLRTAVDPEQVWRPAKSSPKQPNSSADEYAASSVAGGLAHWLLA